MQIQNETIGPAEYIDWYSNGPNQKGKPPGSRNGEQYHMCIAPNGTWVWFDQYLDDQPGQNLVKHAVSSTKIIFTPSSGAPVDLISDGTYAACGSAGQPYLLLSGAPWDYRLQVWGYLTNNTKDLNYWDETVTGPTATVDDCLRPAFTFSAAIRKEAYWSNTVPLRWTQGTGTVDTKGIPDGLKVTYGRTTWDGAGMPYMKILSAKAPVNGGWCVASVVDK